MVKINFIDKAEVQDLFWELMKSLPEESGRGALLVATAHVDDQLTKMLKAILPINSNSEFRRKLFESNGPLSSLSSKIDMCYAFRLIDRNLFTCLHSLRKLRNDAAHSSTSIELVTLNEKLKNVYNLGLGFPEYINQVAIKLLIDNKIELVKDTIDKLNVQDFEKGEILMKAFEENKESLNKQLPHWELICGLIFLCGTIIFYRDEASKIMKNVTIWADLSKEEEVEQSESE